MSDYTVANLKQAEASTSAPSGLEARLARRHLDSEHLGVSFFHYDPGVRIPFGHSHESQEEAYVVIGGSGRAKLGEEIIELRQWDVVRVAPRTMRAFEGGPEGMDLVVIGSDVEEGEGGESDSEFWSA